MSTSEVSFSLAKRAFSVVVPDFLKDADSLTRDVAPRQEDTETMLEHALRVDRLLLPPEKQDDPNATWRDLDVVHVNVGIHFSRGVLGTRCELDTSSASG